MTAWNSDMSQAPRDGTPFIGFRQEYDEEIYIVVWRIPSNNDAYPWTYFGRYPDNLPAGYFSHWAPITPPQEADHDPR